VDEGGVAVAATADVRDEFALDAAFSAIESEVGCAELLVTMAGTAASIGPSWQVHTGDWWADVETNLRGTFLASRRVLPSMISTGHGRIVAVSTYGINRPMPYLSAYAAAKSGVAAFAEALSTEVMGHGVKVFTITPGTVRTGLFENLSDSAEGRRWLPELEERTDTVAPERAADLVVRLGSGEADALSGRFLHVADDLDALLAKGTAISTEDALVLRVRRLNGALTLVNLTIHLLG
jgi:NADP-dependent 3-hydroxy acid dehydrogenase YdfG